MSFLGGPEKMYNDYLLNYIPQMLQANSDIYSRHSQGEKFANNWLKALQHDPGKLLDYDPNKGQYAQQADMAERSTRANMALEAQNQPGLVNRVAQLSRDRSNVSANNSREQFIGGMTGNAMNTSVGAQQFNQAGQAQGWANAMQGYGNAQQIVNKPGWGALAMGALVGGAQAGATAYAG